MPEKETSRLKLPYPTNAVGKVNVGGIDFQELAEGVDKLNLGDQDFLRAGVVGINDWELKATINSATGEIGAGLVSGGVAWLPDPVKSAEGALMRTLAPVLGTIAKKTLSGGSLPAEGKFSCIAYELTPTAWNAEPTITVKAGAEQATKVAAEENPPATTAGKIQISWVIIKRTAGPTYTIEGTKDVRPWAGTTMQIGTTSAYIQAERTAGVEYEPSTTRPVFVTTIVRCSSQGQITVTVGGVMVVGAVIEVSPSGVPGGTFSFICPPRAKWVLTSSPAVITLLKSNYLTL